MHFKCVNSQRSKNIATHGQYSQENNNQLFVINIHVKNENSCLSKNCSEKKTVCI